MIEFPITVTSKKLIDARSNVRISRRFGRAAMIALPCLRNYLSGVVSSVSFVSTTKTARSFAGAVSLALALIL
jgi:hypothetical protein